MKITMRRMVLSGALALAALGAVGGLVPGVPTADAAPSVSEYAGTYDAQVPAEFSTGGVGFRGGEVTIDRKGYFSYNGYWSDDSEGVVSGEGLDGKVTTKGVMTCSGGGSYGGYVAVSWTIDFTATVTKDAAGNLLGTTTDGVSFVWTRK